jgi:RNA recognition motif-containing protein
MNLNEKEIESNNNYKSVSENLNETVIDENETLYVKNLNESIKENEMKATLSNLFQQFGTILEIKMKKTLQCKGQAFISFKDIEEAKIAKDLLEGATLFGKKLEIAFAKTKSDCVLKEKNQFSEEHYLQRKRESQERKDKFYYEYEIKRQKVLENMNNMNKEEIQIPTFKLFVSNINKEVKIDDLQLLFENVSGFKDIRYFEDKGICFVEYENSMQASQALLANNGVEIYGSKLIVKFAKISV